MVYRAPRAAPVSRILEERRGALVGRFCHGCNQIFPLQRPMHAGDPIYGRDHVGSTCPYEGAAFEQGASWWEPAVGVLPAAAPGVPAEAAPAGAPTPPAGTLPAAGGAAAPPPGQPTTGSAPQQGQAAPAPVQPAK